MLTLPKATRGKTVYGRGSYAPNTGRVSAQGSLGYVAREQRNDGRSRFGNDGQSDTRSGLAAQALGRQNNYTGHPVSGEQKPKQHTAKTPYNNQGRRNPAAANSPAPGGGVTPASASGSAVQPAEITVNDAGTLQLPYDSDWSSGVISGLEDYNSQLMELQSAQQQQALDYLRQKNALGQEYDTTKRDTLNAGAGSGAAFSSAYGSTVARNALQNLQSNNELDTDNSQFNQQAEQQRTMIQQAFNNMLRQDALTRAQNIADDAGNLGYGQSASTGGSGGKSKGKGKGNNQAYTGHTVKPKPKPHNGVYVPGPGTKPSKKSLAQKAMKK